ncbi:MAG TPA: Crp/Fnr family transcriptional regulator [Pyrinomonadaceae bacterium]|nr:Crp/Fnr family transcriptional regulator [Pyrinomonadaceae bacterium]
MPVSNQLHLANENKILAALPHDEYDRLLPHLERVHLPQSKILCEAGDTIRYAYFPLNGMISLLSITENGETLEVAMVGNEGLVGMSLALKTQIAPYRINVQLAADAMRINALALRGELLRGGKLEELVLRYTHSVIVHICQSAVCGRFHSVDKRLSRWLLIARDRVHSNNINFTQEIISHMLGTPRTVVTSAAGNLQDAGLIRYRRGRITILNPQGLEASACECYSVVKKEINLSYVA